MNKPEKKADSPIVFRCGTCERDRDVVLVSLPAPDKKVIAKADVKKNKCYKLIYSDVRNRYQNHE